MQIRGLTGLSEGVKAIYVDQVSNLYSVKSLPLGRRAL